MAAGFGYGGFSGLSYPFYIPPPYPYPPASTPPFLPTHPVESSYDQTQGGFHPTIPHRSYHQTPSYDDNSPPLTTPSSFYTQPDNFSLRSEDFPPLTPPSSSYYAQPGNYGPRSEDSCKDMGGYYPSMEPSSSNAVYYPPMARQRLVWPPYSSATVSSLANMLIRNSQEPFFLPIPPSGVCVSSHALALNRPAHYYPGYGNADISGPPVPSLPMPSLNTQGSTGSWNPLSSQPLQFNDQSWGSLYTEKGEASGVSSLYQRPNTLVAHSENRSSEGISAPTMVSMGSESCGAVETDKGNANQLSEDVQVQEQLVDIMNRVKKTTLSTDVSIKGSSLSNADGVSTSQSPICDQGGFTSPASFKRVSTVVNAMHKLSEVLVNECFRNRSLLKPEQLESLDIVVEKLAKCLKKMTANKTITGEEASVPTQAVHVSCPNVVDLNETPNVVAKDCQGVNGKPLDNFGVKELVDKDKNEMMTQSIKNILASKFPDGEENHPKTLLYKNLWLETEAALSSRTCLARYHRIQNETGNLKLQDEEISADESTLKQEPFLNPEESDSIMNIVEQETTESLIKDGSIFGNNVVTMSHDAPQSSRFNSAPVEAVLSLMSRSFTGSLEQETIRKLKSQNCSETRMDEQEDNPDASEMATFGRSSYMSDAMGRLQLLKRPEAEQVQKPLNSVDFDSDSGSDFASDSGSEFDSDSDNDQPRNKIQMYDYLWPGSMMTIGGNSKIETCANTKPSADGKGYDSPTSDWEHVLMDD